jgi:Raf kinase inhibitor-like YbhB/YbcL family protein
VTRLTTVATCPTAQAGEGGYRGWMSARRFSLRSATAWALAAALVLLALWLVATDARSAVGGPPMPGSGFSLRSPAFAHQGEIPRRHTCEGDDVSPPLAWTEPPPGTRSFALIVDDPDAPDPKAPKLTWVHWVLYDLPATARALPEDAERAGLPPGTRVGKNDWQRRSWGGPCPPIGRHRYFHKIYALDAVLPALEAPTKAELERAMQGHVLARAELVGTYQKQRR